MLHDPITADAQRPETQLKAARSELLDAFADLEAAICVFIKDAKLAPKAQHLGARIEAFKAIDGIPRIAKANYSTRDKLASEVAALLPVRADIVHSRMRPCLVDGAPAAKFINSMQELEDFPLCRILTVDELRTMASKVLRIVTQLSQLGRVSNPASLPPPPSQDAAGDP